MKISSMFGGLAFAALVALPALAFAQADDGQPYALVVDGVEYGISVDGTVKLNLPGGQSVDVTLVRRALATYQRPFFSFQHDTELGVATTDLGNNVNQTLMTTPLGTLVLVQEYGALDPSTLIDLMLNELTKEGIRAGGKLSKKTSVRELGAGGRMKGVTAQITSTGSTTLYEVFAKSEGNGGVLVVTSIDQDNQTAEQHYLDRFWVSLNSHAPR